METSITIQTLIQCGLLIMGVWGFFKIVMEIVKAINARHDKEAAWDKAVKDIAVDRQTLKNDFDERLDNQDAKIQQLVAMICMTLRAQDAILEALVDQNIGNGEIRSMHKELKDFIMKQVT